MITQTKRRGITPSIRAEVLRRYDERCYYCGFNEPDALEVDHIIPWSKGGADDIDNYVPACWRCNLEKSDQTPEQWAATRRGQGKPWPIPSPFETASRIVACLPAAVVEAGTAGIPAAALHAAVMAGRESGFDPQVEAVRLLRAVSA